MENILNIQFNWANLLVAFLVLLALRVVLVFLKNYVKRTKFFGGYQEAISKILGYALLIFEPVVFFILASMFVLINPVFHGMIMGLIVVTGFSAIKNYFSGRIIQVDTSLTVGNRLSVQGLQGIISKTGRSGLHLKTNKGLQFIPYAHLYSKGFMILSGDEVGGFYQLKITPKKIEEKIDYKTRLTDLLISAPYVDVNHKPEIFPSLDVPHQLNTKIVVKEERHLYELITLIKEWGFDCKLSKL